MLYPTRLEWQNVACYAGQHEVDLKPSVYAVLARAHDNQERSNWIGKSTFMRLVKYVLFGEHPKRTDDDFITNGQNALMVRIVLSDTSTIYRSKQRGKPTKLEAQLWDGKQLLHTTQAAAQDAIVRHIGLTAADFSTACYFEQKQMGRLLTARSGERLEMIEELLAGDLDPLVRMLERANAEMAVLTGERVKLVAADAQLRSAGQALVQKYSLDPKQYASTQLAERVKAGDRALTTAKQESERLRAELNAAVEARRVLQDAERFDAICAEGVKLRAEFDASPVVDRTTHDEALGAAITRTLECRQELKLLESVGCGFDGVCPVVKAECPSTAWVRANRVNVDAMEAARRELQYAEKAQAMIEQKANALHTQSMQRSALEGRLAQMREQAAALQPAAERRNNALLSNTAPPDLAEQMRQAENAVQAAGVLKMELQHDHEWAQKAEAELATLATKIEAYDKQIALYREACTLLGRTGGGAQQVLVERVLAVVQDEANAMLQSANIALAVQVVWSRQTSGLAKTCDQCGAPYPSSKKATTCQTCGAPRGNHCIHKLDIVLSNESGAAEDLAGIAVGLAASAWLRARKGSAWGALYLDEPFGALDPHHKRALSVQLAALLSRGFVAAYVVAHDKGVLDALPSRVQIVGTPTGSKVESVT